METETSSATTSILRSLAGSGPRFAAIRWRTRCRFEPGRRTRWRCLHGSLGSSNPSSGSSTLLKVGARDGQHFFPTCQVRVVRFYKSCLYDVWLSWMSIDIDLQKHKKVVNKTVQYCQSAGWPSAICKRCHKMLPECVIVWADVIRVAGHRRSQPSPAGSCKVQHIIEQLKPDNDTEDFLVLAVGAHGMVGMGAGRRADCCPINHAGTHQFDSHPVGVTLFPVVGPVCRGDQFRFAWCPANLMPILLLVREQHGQKHRFVILVAHTELLSDLVR